MTYIYIYKYNQRMTRGLYTHDSALNRTRFAHSHPFRAISLNPNVSPRQIVCHTTHAGQSEIPPQCLAHSLRFFCTWIEDRTAETCYKSNPPSHHIYICQVDEHKLLVVLHVYTTFQYFIYERVLCLWYVCVCV